MKNIRLIIFDVYGVLLRGGYPDTSRAIAKKNGGKWKDIYKILYGYFNKAAIREISQKEAWQKSIKKLGLKMLVSKITSIHYSLMSPNMQVFSKVNRLKKSYKVLLLSKNTRQQFSYLTKHIPIIRKTFGKNVINTWEYKLPKASKETMLMVCKRFQLRPEEIIYIDDQKDNLVEAKKMRMNTILYINFKDFSKKIDKLL